MEDSAQVSLSMRRKDDSVIDGSFQSMCQGNRHEITWEYQAYLASLQARERNVLVRFKVDRAPLAKA